MRTMHLKNNLFILWVLFQQITPVNALPQSGLTRKHLVPAVQWFPHRNRGDMVGRLFASSKNMGDAMSRNNFLLALGAAFVSLPALLEVYSRFGARISEGELFPPPQNGSWDDVEHATLVFHGAGGQDQYTDDLMSKFQSAKKSEYSSIVEWSQSSSNFLQASFNGQRIGREAATQLIKQASNLKTIHLIGISVGSFAADAAAVECKASPKDKRPFIQLTLLDPFTQRGIFDFGYGNRVFGKSADYAQQYLNTDDPVPSTNAPLDNTVCYDITDLRPEDITFGHDWPVAYYARSGNVGLIPPEKRLDCGSVIKVEQ
jgi:hypothetical protein